MRRVDQMRTIALALIAIATAAAAAEIHVAAVRLPRDPHWAKPLVRTRRAGHWNGKKLQGLASAAFANFTDQRPAVRSWPPPHE
jgi:hypothetical protein